MCGIAGTFGSSDRGLIREMNQALYHRGPDSEGFFFGDRIQLGMRRLSIIDLASSDQPIFNEKRDKCVVFNGKIYNYKQLQKDLASRGHVFATSTDTEVIIHLYEEYGPRCVEHLRGMFAFAVADGDKLFIARDRLGIKPLYYSFVKEKNLFVFASEIKSLLRCKEVGASLDERAMADRLVMGYIVGDGTYLQAVKTLRPGHHMTVTRGEGGVQVAKEEYYQPRLEPDDSITLDSAMRSVGAAISESVEGHLVADVEVGLTLSGGVDSSILALCMSRLYPERILTFTVGDRERNPDIQLSRSVAAHIKSNHHEELISFEDYLKAIPRSTWIEEQPCSLSVLPCHFLFRGIGSKVKVCLNGEGADELFGGYQLYLNALSTRTHMGNGLARAKELGIIPRDEVASITNAIMSASSFQQYLEAVFPINLTDQLVRHHLDYVDKYSMASSLEVRVPFLDHKLVDFANTLPLRLKVNRDLGIGKYIVKRIALNWFGNGMAHIVLRRKEGFPSASTSYLARFDEICEANLPDAYLKKHELGRWFSTKRELLLFDLFSLIYLQERGTLSDEIDVLDFIRRKSSGPTAAVW
jgi:asparagine synthase (glutamine-hydrolysing)